MAVNPKVQEIESGIFTPMLQMAMKHATDAGHPLEDAILGAANAYLNMLYEVVGKDRALEMIQNQAKFLETQ